MKISVGTEGIMRNNVVNRPSENKEICKHKSDGTILMSNPPKYRCEKCGLSYSAVPNAANDPVYPQKPISENLMLQTLIDSLGFAICDQTYYMYRQRNGLGDFRSEILEESIKIKTLVDYANLSNAYLKINSVVSGYLGINVDLCKEYGLKSA